MPPTASGAGLDLDVKVAGRSGCGPTSPAQMPVTVPGRPPFTTSHLVPGEKIVEVGTGMPVDVHPTRDLFRLADGPDTATS
jgi:hypothetical protein